MTLPLRIQRLRTRGFNLAAVSKKLNGLTCKCATRPGRWGNDYKVGYPRHNPFRGEPVTARTIEDCVRFHREEMAYFLARAPSLRVALDEELRGNNIACFCVVGAPCHGDTLIVLANLPQAWVPGAIRPLLLWPSRYPVNRILIDLGCPHQLCRVVRDQDRGSWANIQRVSPHTPVLDPWGCSDRDDEFGAYVRARHFDFVLGGVARCAAVATAALAADMLRRAG